MRWIEVTVNCTGDPDLMCADLAELGVGGMETAETHSMSMEWKTNRILKISWKITTPTGIMWTKNWKINSRVFPG